MYKILYNIFKTILLKFKNTKYIRKIIAKLY